MPFFSETVAAQLAGRTVGAAILAHFDFTTTPMRVWMGHGLLRAGGFEWKGVGHLGSMEGLERAVAGSAPTATFTMSGVDPALLIDVKNSAAEVKGRDVTVFLQFFDDLGVRLDDPYAVYAGALDVMSIAVSGTDSAIISVTAEQAFARRGSPLWGTLSDRDQKRLYPGDEGLDRIAQIPFTSATWPIIEVSSK